VRVLVADDHAIVRRGVRRLLEVAGLTVVAEAADGLEAFHLCIQHHPDTLVLDIEMPKLNGFEVVMRVRRLAQQPSVIFYSAHEEESYVIRAIEMGVRAYLVKGATDEDLVPAIYAVAAGRPFLSPGVITVLLNAYVRRLRNRGATEMYQSLTDREKQILRLLAEWYGLEGVTAILGPSPNAVDSHCGRLTPKFDRHRCTRNGR
jgi:two-component system, NarL family, response regulator NreC